MKKFEQAYKKIISQAWFSPDYQSDLPEAQKQEIDEYIQQNITPERRVEIIKDLLNYLNTGDGYDFLDTVSMNDMIPEVQVQIAKIDDSHIMSQFGICVRSYEGFQALLNNPQIVGLINAFHNKYMPNDLLPQFYNKIEAAYQANPQKIASLLDEWLGMSNPEEMIKSLPKAKQQILINQNNNTKSLAQTALPKRRSVTPRRPR